MNFAPGQRVVFSRGAYEAVGTVKEVRYLGYSPSVKDIVIEMKEVGTDDDFLSVRLVLITGLRIIDEARYEFLCQLDERKCSGE